MALLVFVMIVIGGWASNQSAESSAPISIELERQLFETGTAIDNLESLEVKGRAPKTGYSRKQFGDGWGRIEGCSVREVILARDLSETVFNPDDCRVVSGRLYDPYTANIINFIRGPQTSQEVQIDHVVALSDAWQKGAQSLSFDERVRFSNDPLNLLAVEGAANQQKGDSDAASWLPSNRAFRCQYVARQVAVKKNYRLWVTDAEKKAIRGVLDGCLRQDD